MIYNYPFFSSSGFRRYTPHVNYAELNAKKLQQESLHRSEKSAENKEPKKSEELPKSKSENSRHEDGEFFEIFGLKLYFDDILLIGLLYFLYSEGVKDQYLFISLIMLLLS